MRGASQGCPGLSRLLELARRSGHGGVEVGVNLGWKCIRTQGIATRSAQPSQSREGLEQKLAEVKQLYQQKCGQEVDEEDMSVHCDADGTHWIQTSGTGVARDLRMERLEQMLSGVNDLYSEKYGRDVDIENDADGTDWKVTEGTGVPRACGVERFEQKLAEVKQLCQQKYDQEVDECSL